MLFINVNIKQNECALFKFSYTIAHSPKILHGTPYLKRRKLFSEETRCGTKSDCMLLF